MARGVNKVILIGHLGADPEVRYSTSGTAIANFRIATTESFPAGEGNWEERTEWHRIVAFGKTAENCGQYLSKGRQVYVEGRLQTRQWEDKDGNKRFTTEVVAREVQFLGGPGGQMQPSDSAFGSGEAQRSLGGALGEELPPPANVQDDEIPF